MEFNKIRRLKSTLLIPSAQKLERYVPIFVYSCRSMIHLNDLIISYAMTDYASIY